MVWISLPVTSPINVQMVSVEGPIHRGYVIGIPFRFYRKEYCQLTIRMKRNGYSLLGLFVVLVVAVAVLPWVRRTFARSFPEGFQAMTGVDSRKGDCKGVNCDEGYFCQENKCIKSYPDERIDYFPTGPA